MMNRLHRFMFYIPEPKQIDLVYAQSDPDMAKRIDQKIEEAKRKLGEKYLLHPQNRVQRVA